MITSNLLARGCYLLLSQASWALGVGGGPGPALLNLSFPICEIELCVCLSLLTGLLELAGQGHSCLHIGLAVEGPGEGSHPCGVALWG